MLAESAIAAWALGALAYLARRRALGDCLTLAGVALAGVLLALMWFGLDRPPLRTLGETRWWFAAATPAIGFIAGWRFETRLFGAPANILGGLFAGINLAHPEYMDRTLMPALQSPWFVPHVVTNLVSYASLGLASILAGSILIQRKIQGRALEAADADGPHRLVMIGLPLLTAGLCMGAFWAKEAWGHYWAWDPKETWALVTWCAYLAYLHVRVRHASNAGLSLALLVLAFAVLLTTWFGVAFMPTARESVHTYAQE